MVHSLVHLEKAVIPEQASPPQYLWIGDETQTRFRWVSPSLVEFLGYSAAEWKSEHFVERLVHPEDSSLLAEAWRRVAETGRTLTVEIRVSSADEGFIPLSVQLDTFHLGEEASGGGVSGIIGIVRPPPSCEGFTAPVTAPRHPSCIPVGQSAPEGPGPWLCALKHAEQELTRTQRQYEELIDTIDGIVWEADENFRFTFVSKQAERLLGHPRQLWLEDPEFWVKHLHPQDREWASSFCRQATAECRPHEFEYRMVTAEGHVVWLRDIVTVVVENGRPLKLRGIMVDVTEQRWIRESQEHTVSMLRATLDSTTEGVLVVDKNKRITAVNEQFQKIWRIPNELLDGWRDELTLAHALGQLQNPEQFLTSIMRVYRRPEAEDSGIAEFRDGRIVEWYSLPQRVGERIVGRVWSFRDMTERVRTERERDRLLVAEQAARERLEESFALLDTLLKNAPIGLGFVDCNLRYIRVNDALAAYHGRNREEEEGRTIHDAMPLLAPRVEPFMRHVLESGEPIIDAELTGETPDSPGEQRHWRVSYYPVRLPSGCIVGVGIAVVEVTAERRAQAERERLLREAQEAIRVRDDFLSIASHELKTPLTPLMLHLQSSKKRLATGQPVPTQLVEKMLAQVGRLSTLISDLLDASRAGVGRMAMECAPLSLRELVGEVLSVFLPVSDKHQLEYEEPEEEFLIQGDRGRLVQVLTNLMENALKYSPTGGAIRVSVERDGAHAVVSVSDTGIGIPPDQQQHIFDRFFRARNAPISGFGGLGLGLYICRDIVERHGGRIWVESEVGRGSTFRFSLPT